MRKFPWSSEGEEPNSVGADGYPIYAGDPYKSSHETINVLLKKPSSNSLQAIEKEENPVRVRILYCAALRAALVWEEESYSDTYDTLIALIKLILKSKITLNETAVVGLLSRYAAIIPHTDEYGLPLEISTDLLLARIQAYLKDNPLTDGIQNALVALKEGVRKLAESFFSAREKKLMLKIDELLHVGKVFHLEPKEPWAKEALEEIQQLPTDERAKWDSLLLHLVKPAPPEPTQAWLNRTEKLVSEIGKASFQKAILWWLPLVELPHDRPLKNVRNNEALKGIIWTCSLLDGDEIVAAVAQTAKACLKKLRNIGARSPKVGNACILVLAKFKSPLAVSSLVSMKSEVKYATAQKLIQRALSQSASGSGLSSEDLQERSVPTFGFSEIGHLQVQIGDYTAILTISNSNSCSIAWLNKQRKTLKTAPGEIRKRFSADYKRFKETETNIDKTLAVWKSRLERLFLSNRQWPLNAWKDRFIRHPILSTLASRLIWTFKTQHSARTAIWDGAKLIDARGEELYLPETTPVELWHPVGESVELITAWRTVLHERGITQPFKQAYRETYVLTPAESDTLTHSNRFAGHIIRQHQFAALCEQRQWKYRLMGSFDFFNRPTFPISGWPSAEFWVETVRDENSISDSGIYLYLSTDQLRFSNNSGNPVPVNTIPPKIFSEVMRDVDLFISVCSIGNDPLWGHARPLPRYGEYWGQYSFGELSQHGKSRRDYLERLLPSLNIAGKCRLQGNFLVVKGDLRTYKIHIGSSNILMEPNDRYLCVVADQSAKARREVGELFLPFDEDYTLSLILSKAFLLASDAKIRDRDILRQIKHEDASE